MQRKFRKQSLLLFAYKRDCTVGVLHAKFLSYTKTVWWRVNQELNKITQLLRVRHVFTLTFNSTQNSTPYNTSI